MTNVSSAPQSNALGEAWIVRVLQGIDIGAVARQVVVRLDDSRVCLSVMASGSDEAWKRYSDAAAKRAAVTGDRLSPLLASGRTDDCFYVAYDVGDSQPLSAYGDLAELSGAQVVQLLHGVGRGLDQAAAGGVFPSELSPESVFVDPSRGGVLADLGIAREALGNPPPGEDRNAPWVAPEVLEGGEAVERSSVYSFGALMFTLLTGTPPRADTSGELSSAEVPSVRERRPDLPETLDLVVATAMARDPRRRYRTASETRSLANILLQGDLVPISSPEPPVLAPPADKPEAAPAPKPRKSQAVALRRQSPEAVAAPKRRRARPPAPKTAAKPQPARPRKADRRRPKAAPRVRTAALPVVALVAAVIGAGAVAGLLLAPGPEEPPPPKNFSRSGLDLRLPGNWQGSVPAPGALAAHPVGDPGSGLTVEPVNAPVERSEQGNPVQLGRLEAWREPEAQIPGARAGVRYVIPTETGKVVATCRASPRAVAGTLGACERVASTLQLSSATGLPIAAVVEQQERWRTEVERLAKERAQARRKLARAELPAGQRLAAQALVRVHGRATKRLADVPGGKAAAEASSRTSAAYFALAAAANGESSRSFNRARASVRRSEARLRQALAQQ